MLVSFYLTVAPSPVVETTHWLSSFLWHYPHGYPHQALPGDALYGARTFLKSPPTHFLKSGMLNLRDHLPQVTPFYYNANMYYRMEEFNLSWGS
jgi:hypothetical protein